MNLLYYHHHHHGLGSEKALLAFYILINTILISIMIIRTIIWLTKKEKPLSLFEYAIFSRDPFITSGPVSLFFLLVNGLALFFYLMILLIPYL